MDENLPPSEPSKPAPAVIFDEGAPPSKKACTALGGLLFIVSSGLAFVFPPLCLVGFVAAVISLFFKGYRCIFVGYILAVGLILLAVIIYCANNPVDFR
jgi:hypothetical protein